MDFSSLSKIHKSTCRSNLPSSSLTRIEPQLTTDASDKTIGAGLQEVTKTMISRSSSFDSLHLTAANQNNSTFDIERFAVNAAFWEFKSISPGKMKLSRTANHFSKLSAEAPETRKPARQFSILVQGCEVSGAVRCSRRTFSSFHVTWDTSLMLWTGSNE